MLPRASTIAERDMQERGGNTLLNFPFRGPRADMVIKKAEVNHEVVSKELSSSAMADCVVVSRLILVATVKTSMPRAMKTSMPRTRLNA